jgi:SAM-dependent methyltransferase
MLYLLRNLLWSRRVQWLEGQAYYERAGTVDRYDTASAEPISTLRRPTSHQLVSLMKERGAKSVLDIGCGAGAFFSILPEGVRYFGIDASNAQVERARERHGARFEVRDASTLSAGEISRFDAVHAYSVFPFMSVSKQLRLLRAIMESGVLTILEIGATERRLDYVPSESFRNLGKAKVNGRKLLAAVSYPYRDDISVPASYSLTWEQTECSAPYCVNVHHRDGGALCHAKPPRFPKRPKRMKMLIGLIQKVR